MFYEVSITSGAYLITGNAGHYPKAALVISSQEFLYVVNDHLKGAYNT
jgi:hypothetical protein